MSFTANPFFFTLQKHYELYLINKNFLSFTERCKSCIKKTPDNHWLSGAKVRSFSLLDNT